MKEPKAKGLNEIELHIEELEERIVPSGPGAIYIIPGLGAEVVPPDPLVFDTPPPAILFFVDGTFLLRGFHFR